MEHFNDLECFVAVAETKAFASAARRLGASTSGVSKSIARLEARLGVRLFIRTTRRVTLTIEGEGFYIRAREILESLADAESELTDASTALRGRIRIDLPMVFGERHILPLLVAFKQLHPEVELDIKMSDLITNLVEDNIDVALRFGADQDSGIIARALGEGKLVTCASPDYIKRKGTPISIAELEDHDCIAFQFRSTQRIFKWRFNLEDTEIEQNPRTGIIVNDGAAHRRLALLGAGIIQELNFNVDAEIASGQLVQVLGSHAINAFAISLVWPARRYQPKRVRALIDFLVQKSSGFR